MKILFYTANHLLASEASDTRYVHDGLARHFDVSVSHRADASLCRSADVVFCRFPKPAPADFLHQLACESTGLVINNPTAQLRLGTKRNLLHFPDLTVPTIISASLVEIGAFADVYGELVVKPLDRHKGQGVHRVSWNRRSPASREQFLTTYVREFGVPMVQPYLEQVTRLGDKRINIFRFEAVSAVLTLPRAGSFLCHEALGGAAHPADITAQDRRVIRHVAPFLRDHGIWWAGIDMIGPYLSEINVATPAMLQRADQVAGNTQGLDAVIDSLTSYQPLTSAVGAA